VTNDRPWRLADLSFAPSGNGRERATINGVEVVRDNGRYWITTPNGPLSGATLMSGGSILP
jgi:sugar lactone lactonase YvrE